MADVNQPRRAPSPEPEPEPEHETYDIPEKADDELDDLSIFDLPVDASHKALKIVIFKFSRPHMRAFHFAWFSFFLAFFGWFAISPLLNTIAQSPNLGLDSKSARVNSNIIAVSGTIFLRIVIGPVCDRYGPRVAQSSLLIFGALPVGLVGLSQSYAAFCSFRFFIGFVGATFVVTQFWASSMFALPIVGAANAITAGWGNLGGGITNILMPQLFNMLTAFGLSDDQAWRTVMIFPSLGLLACGAALFFLADDCPDGNYAALIKAGSKPKTNPFVALRRAVLNWRVWILHLAYALCFGVELVMNGNLSSYFQDNFGLSQGTAGLIAGLFGLMNLFGRALGGLGSDFARRKHGMRGRLWSFFVFLFLEGVMLVVFSRMYSLAGAICLLLLFSFFTQMTQGATFGVVPYVDPVATGAVSGIVGAGGSVGAVCLNILFRSDDDHHSLLVLGLIVLGGSFSVCLLWWPKYGSMFLRPAVAEDEEEEEPGEEEEEPEGAVVFCEC